MEYKLTTHEAVRLFDVWCRELEAAPGIRSVENGSIHLDSVPSTTEHAHGQRLEHAMDGSLLIVWYVAAGEASSRAIREAAAATSVMGLPRQLYTGRLIDILRSRDGTVYFKVRSIERIDETTHQPAFRSFNPSKGQLIEMTINPAAAAVAEASISTHAVTSFGRNTHAIQDSSRQL